MVSSIPLRYPSIVVTDSVDISLWLGTQAYALKKAAS